MSIHEHLPPQARHELKQVGWTKGLELAKVARRDGQHFDCATWLHKAREMPKDEFKHEVEKELTGKDEEPSELIYFKLYKSQIPVIEQAIETAARMLGSDKSRGYCLEMICADFLAGAHLDGENPEILLNSVSRYYRFLPKTQKEAFLAELQTNASWDRSFPNGPGSDLYLRLTGNSIAKCSSETAGDANPVARCPILRSIIECFVARAATTRRTTSLRFAEIATDGLMDCPSMASRSFHDA